MLKSYGGVSEVSWGNSDVKNPPDELRIGRDFRLFSLITVVFSIWGNRGPNRGKMPGGVGGGHMRARS